jgi:hypothetical protein
MGDATEIAQSDPWFRPTSPERAIQLCETSYYPHLIWSRRFEP